jgi:hypothetical protein
MCVFHRLHPMSILEHVSAKVTHVSLHVCRSRAVAQAGSRRPSTAETRIRSYIIPCEIYGRQTGTETDFFSSTSVSLVSIILLMRRIYSLSPELHNVSN